MNLGGGRHSVTHNNDDDGWWCCCCCCRYNDGNDDNDDDGGDDGRGDGVPWLENRNSPGPSWYFLLYSFSLNFHLLYSDMQEGHSVGKISSVLCILLAHQTKDLKVGGGDQPRGHFVHGHDKHGIPVSSLKMFFIIIYDEFVLIFVSIWANINERNRANCFNHVVSLLKVIKTVS